MNNCEIVLGHKAFFNRTVFQACAAKTVTEREANKSIQAMKLKFKNCIWAGIAYKTSRAEDYYEEITGLGNKILLLMSRMDAINLTIGISIWYSGNIATHDCNRMVLDRTMDMINYMNSLEPPEVRAKTPEIEHIFIEPEPIGSHKYPEFPTRPTPAPPPPFDIETERLRNKLKEILSIFDDAEIRSLNELTSHSIIGKVLEMIYCLLSSVPCNPTRLKAFFLKENVLELLKEFEPTNLKKQKIRELKKLMKLHSYLEPDRIEIVSHSSVLLLEYIQTVALIIEEVPLPKPYERISIPDDSIPEPEPKQVIRYRSLTKPQPRSGIFLDTTEGAINNNYSISPLKIAIKDNVISEPNLDLRLIHQYSRSFALERYSSVDISKKMHGLSKNSMKFSQNSIEMSKQSIQFSKISLGVSKKSIEMSHKNIDPDEDIIDRVLKINPHRIDSWGALDINPNDNDYIRNIKLEDIEKQPTSLLLKFAEVLKDRREIHNLI